MPRTTTPTGPVKAQEARSLRNNELEAVLRALDERVPEWGLRELEVLSGAIRALSGELLIRQAKRVDAHHGAWPVAGVPVGPPIRCYACNRPILSAIYNPGHARHFRGWLHDPDQLSDTGGEVEE